MSAIQCFFYLFIQSAHFKAVSWIYRLPSKYVHFVGYAFLTTNLCFFLTTFCLDSHLMKIKILNKLDYCQEAMSFVSKPIQGKPLGCSINRLLAVSHHPPTCRRHFGINSKIGTFQIIMGLLEGLLFSLI